MLNKKSDSHFDSVTKFLRFSKSKRSQSQIITTVLIILLVLAAIVIVWQVVNNTIQSGAEQVKQQSSCLGINLNIESIGSGATPAIKVKRETGGPAGPISVSVFIGGTIQSTKITGLDRLGTGIYTHTAAIPAGTVVAIAPVVDNVQCDILDSMVAP